MDYPAPSDTCWLDLAAPLVYSSFPSFLGSPCPGLYVHWSLIIGLVTDRIGPGAHIAFEGQVPTHNVKGCHTATYADSEGSEETGVG